jgi:hypothetical protein
LCPSLPSSSSDFINIRNVRDTHAGPSDRALVSDDAGVDELWAIAERQGNRARRAR